MVEFEWDDVKRLASLENQGVDFIVVRRPASGRMP